MLSLKKQIEVRMSESKDQPKSGGQNTIGYLELIRTNPNFRSLWFGQIVSLFGDWFNLIASAALVSSLTKSGLAVGGLFVVRMLAPFLVSPLAGVVVDRNNRKQLLILTDILRAVIVLGFLVVRDGSLVWLLYTLTAFQLALSGFFFPARNAILPDIVSRRELGTANALSASTWSVMLALGAALGGLATGSWGIYPAFIIDSFTFLLTAFFISQVRYTHIPKKQAVSLRAIYSDYIEGLRYLGQHRDVLVVASLKGALSLVAGGIFQVVEVAIAERVFPLGEGSGLSLGLLYTAAGIGTGIGPILARRFTGDNERKMRLAIIAAYGLSAAGMLTGGGVLSRTANLGTAGGLNSVLLLNFSLVLLGVLIQAIGGGLNWVFSTQLPLQLLPDRVRGRIFSTEFAMFTLANAVSAAIGGWALDGTQLSLSTLLVLIAGMILIPGALWILWTVRHLRQPEPVQI